MSKQSHPPTLKKLVPKWLKKTKKQEPQFFKTNSKSDLLDEEDDVTNKNNQNPLSETSSSGHSSHGKSKVKKANSNEPNNTIGDNNNASSNDEEPVLAWYFDPIPHSFHVWLTSLITGKGDKDWDLNDELTINSTCEV